MQLESMRERVSLPLVLTGLTIAGLTGCANPQTESESTGQSPQTASAGAQIVAPGVISTSEQNQNFPAENPKTGALWFSVYDDDFEAQTLMVAERTPNGWAAPVQAGFQGPWGGRAPRFDASGDTLYFTSNRPRSDDPNDAWNVWRSVRTEDGWEEPTLMDAPVNSSGPDIHAVVTSRAFWVPSRREGTFGRSDVYRVGFDGREQHLPAPLNDANSQPDLWVSPDETWMILVVTDRESGFGGDDLYFSEFVDGTWTEPENLGPEVNGPGYEYGPSLSIDGRYLYFNSHRGETADIYRIPVGEARNGRALPDRR